MSSNRSCLRAEAFLLSSSNTYKPFIFKLASQIKELQKEAEVLGLFVEDRELLKCCNCRLSEDVGIDGRLFTYFGDETAPDTGLRFTELDEERFQCPSCGTKVKLEIE